MSFPLPLPGNAHGRVFSAQLVFRNPGHCAGTGVLAASQALVVTAWFFPFRPLIFGAGYLLEQKLLKQKLIRLYGGEAEYNNVVAGYKAAREKLFSVFRLFAFSFLIIKKLKVEESPDVQKEKLSAYFMKLQF